MTPRIDGPWAPGPRSSGLYTQRRQGGPNPRPEAVLPEELHDEFFMLRVRLSGEVLSTGQLRVLAGISGDFARGTADITDRANLQCHWVRSDDVPRIRRLLGSVGLGTTDAPGDCARVVMGSPVAGIAADEVLDTTGTLRRVRDAYLADPSLADLPRKYRTSISWLPDTAPELNDVSFVGVQHPQLGPGFDLLVGGGASVGPRLATRLGAFVTAERLPDVWLAVTHLFRDHGQRRLRGRARMKYLVDDWGTDRFRRVLENAYLGHQLPDGPAAPVPTQVVDHVGIHAQRDGRRYVGFSTTAGRLSGGILAQVADAVATAGSDRLVLTTFQKILVLDVEKERVDALVERMARLGLYAEPSPWRRSVMACTGLEFCKLAVVDTKQRASQLVDELERRLAHLRLDRPISVHLNGCPNSCARVQTADIGLSGRLVRRDGAWVEGFQVRLGGGLAADAGFGRRVRGVDVASTELGDYIERLALRYVEDREDGERFAQWAQRVESERLT